MGGSYTPVQGWFSFWGKGVFNVDFVNDLNRVMVKSKELGEDVFLKFDMGNKTSAGISNRGRELKGEYPETVILCTYPKGVTEAELLKVVKPVAQSHKLNVEFLGKTKKKPEFRKAGERVAWERWDEASVLQMLKDEPRRIEYYNEWLSRGDPIDEDDGLLDSLDSLLKKKKIRVNGHRVVIASGLNRKKAIDLINSFNNAKFIDIRTAPKKGAGSMYVFRASKFAADGILKAWRRAYPQNEVELKYMGPVGGEVLLWGIFIIMEPVKASVQDIVASCVREAMMNVSKDAEMAEDILKDLKRLQGYLTKAVVELEKVKGGGESPLNSTSQVVAMLRDGKHFSKAVEYFFA